MKSILKIIESREIATRKQRTITGKKQELDLYKLAKKMV
ncbi:MAG TPA: hypothetical protein DHV15_04350 [Treponema sp.]|uniref:Uncharacterized protein n=2 Tax=Treponema TaxID=157 RepID=Q73KP5_TREDE|nr:hypothetical protein TDE_2172 [Treponema denticola ATCC 35405]UTY24433.1 hypothetical protein E4N78_10120 [Treponema denticola]UTY31580.1 hypothetical protein E4N75_08870 [Treponema putidum]HCY94730.1 hypothetical protein [Treponema sp.]UTY26445.1 hypothetical protein E4N77_07020 [Treponema denticola]